MLRKVPLRRSSRLSPGGRPKAKKRKPSEFARIYGSKARVEWIKGLPCAVNTYGNAACGDQSENAHTASGGTGRKAGHETIAPLCHYHHRLLHSEGVRSFSEFYDLDLPAIAAATQTRWERIANA
jgi:hypothetical protein